MIHTIKENLGKDIFSYYFFKFFRTITFILSHTFVPIYLYSDLGYSIFQTALFVTIVHFFVIPFIPFTSIVIKYIGVKKSISLHIFGMALFFYLLQFLSGNFVEDLPMILALALIKSTPKAFYSVSEKIYMNEKILKCKKSFGEKIAYVNIILILAGILSPLLGGILTYFYGFGNFFNIIAITTLIGVIPLIFTKDFRVDYKSEYLDIVKFVRKKMDKGLKMGIFGQEFSSSILQTIWPIFIIIIVGNTLNVGYLLSISAFIGILVSFFIGKFIDKKSLEPYFGKIVYLTSFIFFTRVIFPSPLLIAITDSINKIVKPVFEIPFDSYVFKYLHSFENKSFVTTAYVFYFEIVYLIGFLSAAIYFGLVELFGFEYTYLVFVIIFACYGLSILLTRNVLKIRN